MAHLRQEVARLEEEQSIAADATLESYFVCGVKEGCGE